MYELEKAIEVVLLSNRGEDDVLVTREELVALKAGPDEDFTVACTLVETAALAHLREVYERVKKRL